MIKDKWIQIRVSQDELKQIKRFCKKHKTTISELVRGIVEELSKKDNLKNP